MHSFYIKTQRYSVGRFVASPDLPRWLRSGRPHANFDLFTRSLQIVKVSIKSVGYNKPITENVNHDMVHFFVLLLRDSASLPDAE